LLPQHDSAGHSAFIDYFRCPEDFARLERPATLSADEGYFTFDGVTCYGRRSDGATSPHVSDFLPDASDTAQATADGLRLPFDLTSVVTNLRQEKYRLNGYTYMHRLTSGDAARQMYYFLRPMLRVGIRRHLQKIRLSGWENSAFLRWSVDVSN
jgi:hypothetical protein